MCQVFAAQRGVCPVKTACRSASTPLRDTGPERGEVALGKKERCMSMGGRAGRSALRPQKTVRGKGWRRWAGGNGSSVRQVTGRSQHTVTTCRALQVGRRVPNVVVVKALLEKRGVLMREYRTTFKPPARPSLRQYLRLPMLQMFMYQPYIHAV